MKFLNRIFVVLTTLNLMIGTFAWAQKNTEGEKQTITISGSTGLRGVVMEGLPGNPITDINGFYTATVESSWSGTVAPVKEGYTFDPPSRSYPKTTANQTDQNYAAGIITFTISGSTGLRGVLMEGLPSNPISRSDGTYKATVPYGWAGMVTPQRKGYTFEPTSRAYAAVISDQINQDYVTNIRMLTISGRFIIGGYPIEGVLISTSKDGTSDTTDVEGRYSVKVPYGWSGEITWSKKGSVFRPSSKSYSNVTTDIIDDQLIPPLRHRLGSQRRTIEATRPTLWRTDRRKVLVIPVTDVNAADIDTITQDLQVMAHILDGKFTERRQIAGIFTDFGDFFGRDERETETIYLQGYGALFLMEVNFVFSPQPQPQQKETKEPQEQLDSTWQQAQRELFSPQRPGNVPGEVGSLEEYDAQMVEELKRELIGTLKHATNIRGLQADEWVIFNVTGAGQRPIGGYGGSSYSYSGSYTGGGSYGGGGGFGYRMGGMNGGIDSSPMEFTSSTVLTIRAKKSDIDTFAKGDMDFDQFRQKVQIFIY